MLCISPKRFASAALPRAVPKDASTIEESSPIIAMTTRSSMRVNPRVFIVSSKRLQRPNEDDSDYGKYQDDKQRLLRTRVVTCQTRLNDKSREPRDLRRRRLSISWLLELDISHSASLPHITLICPYLSTPMLDVRRTTWVLAVLKRARWRAWRGG